MRPFLLIASSPTHGTSITMSAITIMATASTTTSATPMMRGPVDRPLTPRSRLPMDAAMIHHRSCHPIPEASPLAVGEAGYGWIGMVVSRLVRPSAC